MTPEEQAAYDLVQKRAAAYRAAFAHPMIQDMLIDLAKFCKAGMSAAPEIEEMHFDPNRILLILGRQQVWLWIQNQLNLQPSQLYRLYTGRHFTPGE